MNNAVISFDEVSQLIDRYEFEAAYEKLDSRVFAKSSRAEAIKAFLNYSEYTKHDDKHHALDKLTNLSNDGVEHATLLLAKAYLLPGKYESFAEALPNALSLAKCLYDKKFGSGLILYANLLRMSKQYDVAWAILEEAKFFEEIKKTNVYALQLAIIKESKQHLSYLSMLFEFCRNEYEKGNLEICAVYSRLLLDPELGFLEPALGLKVLEDGINESNPGCKLIKAAILVSHEWYVKRDVQEAVDILENILSCDKHDQVAKTLLSQIYLSERLYHTHEYGRKAVVLLGSNLWYGNIQDINLLLVVSKKYELTDCDYFYKALEIKAKAEGKHKAFKIFRLLIKLTKPIDYVWKTCVLVISFILAFIISSVRFLLLYILNLLRLLLK